MNLRQILRPSRSGSLHRPRRSAALSLTALATLAVSAVLGLPLSASAATAPPTTAPPATGIGIQLLDIPAATQTDPRARSYIVDNLAPGTTIQRRIRVANTTDAAQPVRVYAAAARITRGSFVGAAGSTPDELSTWISAAEPQLVIPAHSSADDLITIAVPADAAEGEQYAAVWAEMRSAPAGKGGTNVTGVSRVGIRVYLSVAPGNGPHPDFAISSITAQRDADGVPRIVAAVENTGARAVDLSGTLSLSGGAGGLSAGPFPIDRVVTLAPHTTGAVSVTLDGSLPRGPWDARLELNSGLLSHGITATLTFPAAAGQHQTVAAPARSPLPWVIGGAAAALVVAVALALGARTVIRRRRLR